MYAVSTEQTRTDDFNYVTQQAIKVTGQTQNYNNYDGDVVCYTTVYKNDIPSWCSVAQSRDFYPDGVVGVYRKLFSTLKEPGTKGNNEYSIIALSQQWQFCINAGYSIGFISTEKKLYRFFKNQLHRYNEATNSIWHVDENLYRVCNGDASCNQYVVWSNTDHCPFTKVKD